MAGAPLRSLQAAVAAILLALSSSALAVVYKWVEEDGKVIYSNEPPSDPGSVREVTRIDDLQLAPTEKPVLEPAAAEKRSPDTAVAVPEPVPGLSREAVTLVPREPVTLLPKEPIAPTREAEAAPREAEAPQRVFPRSTHTGAVQDPCLMSPDPRCHERNRGRYHPYLGYSPGEATPQNVGAGATVSGSGAVGGRVPAPQSAIVPAKRGAQALPPGNAPSGGIEWSKTVR